jgi:hypothetical protein
MDPKPVELDAAPKYPTRRQLLKGGAALVLFGPIFGCDKQPAEVAYDYPDLSGLQSPGRTSVAPIFEHGGGRGATGCVVISPPVFLSEEEALQIIKEELGEAGIDLDHKLARELPGVVGNCTEWYYVNMLAQFEEYATDGNMSDSDIENMRSHFLELQNRADLESEIVPIQTDAESKMPPVAIQFISRGDCGKYRAKEAGYSSVTDYDSKNIAIRLAEAIGEQSSEEMFVGIFYDPLTNSYWLSKQEGVVQDPKECSIAELRLQAKDFVAWLKEQEAI